MNTVRKTLQVDPLLHDRVVELANQTGIKVGSLADIFLTWTLNKMSAEKMGELIEMFKSLKDNNKI